MTNIHFIKVDRHSLTLELHYRFILTSGFNFNNLSFLLIYYTFIKCAVISLLQSCLF